MLGLSPSRSRFHTEMAGGGFGRRAVPDSDDAASRRRRSPSAWPAATPVKLVWTREDDIRGGYYRPMHVHRVEIGVDARRAARGVATTSIVGQSLVEGTPFEAMMMKDGIDGTIGRGRLETRLRVPDCSVARAPPEGQRAGAVVALGRPHALGLRDGDAGRRAGAARPGIDPVAVPAQRLMPVKHARASRGARAGGRAVAATASAPAGRAMPGASACTSRSIPSWPTSPRSRCAMAGRGAPGHRGRRLRTASSTR